MASLRTTYYLHVSCNCWQVVDLTVSSMERSTPTFAIHGTIIHSLSLTDLQIQENTLVLVKSGKIHSLDSPVSTDQVPTVLRDRGYTDPVPVRYLERSQFLIPGFVDTHNHAPQWAQRGIGRGISLLDWLDKVTFAHEAKFKDPAYARRMYSSCVSGFLKQGITTASYYGSKHGDASKILAEVCLELGQRALVGKCNMNRHAPGWYSDESTESSLNGTRDFLDHISRLDPGHDLVQPVLTPRFAISCEEHLLRGLGDLAAKNPWMPIQTHFNEARDEMEFTKSLFPGFRNEADLYESMGLLNSRSILAHCIFLQDEEMTRLRDLGCGIAHCPISNTCMSVYMVAPIREYLRRGIKVGLGTDSGGGFSSSMLEVMKHAFLVSNARQTSTDGKDASLSLAECFFLATLGGAQVCGLGERIGNFTVGKEFDALVIDGVVDDGVMAPVEDEDGIGIVFEKFLMTGDDRNIVGVFVGGRTVRERV